MSEGTSPFTASGPFVPAGSRVVKFVKHAELPEGRLALSGQNPPPPPPLVSGGHADPDDDKNKPGKIAAGIVATDRIRFLERMEKLLDSDRRVQQLEEENAALARVIARQQEEIAALKRGEKP